MESGNSGRRVVFIDTETDGLQWFKGHRPFAVGYAFAGGPPGGSKDTVQQSGESGVVVCEPGDRRLLSMLSDDSITKVFHNAPFDMHMLRMCEREGVGRTRPSICGRVEDTMHLAHLLGHERLGLKHLAKSVLGEDIGDEQDVKEWLKRERARRKKILRNNGQGVPYVEPNYSDVPRPLIDRYLRGDVGFTMGLYNRLRENVRRICEPQYQIESALIPVIVDMERVGMKVDMQYFRRESAIAQSQIAIAEARMRKEFGEDFNPRSSKQIAEKMFKQLKLRVLKRTAKGNPSTDMLTLSEYDNPHIKSVVSLRQMEKLRSTYYEGILEACDSDGVLHPSFRQNGARTGRFSCASPNLQNIPRRDKSVRKGIITRPGRTLIFVDYGQIEMRLFAHYSGDEKLISIINSGEDLHTVTANLLFGMKHTPAHRQIAKTINFGIIYGMGAKKLADAATKLLMDEGQQGHRYTVDEAKNLLKRYYSVYPAVKPFMRSVTDEVRQVGFATDAYGKRYFVDDGFEYKGVNYLVQGTAAQVMKRAMLEVWRHLRRTGAPVDIVNTVHDEIVYEVDNGFLREHGAGLVGQITGLMEANDRFSVQLPVEASYSTGSWADKTELSNVQDITAVV